MELLEYKCYYENCSKSYKTKYNLRRHINSNHLLIKEFSCQICMKSFASKQNLQGHEKTHNKTEEMTELEIPFMPLSSNPRKYEDIRELMLSKIYIEKKTVYSIPLTLNMTSKPTLPLICEERINSTSKFKLPVIPILL